MFSMSQLQAELARRGHPHIRAPRIRSMEEGGLIPLAGRDWKGARLFGDEHVEAIVERLAKRQQRNHDRIAGHT